VLPSLVLTKNWSLALTLVAWNLTIIKKNSENPMGRRRSLGNSLLHFLLVRNSRLVGGVLIWLRTCATDDTRLSWNKRTIKTQMTTISTISSVAQIILRPSKTGVSRTKIW
jgi:hypothetical protein